MNQTTLLEDGAYRLEIVHELILSITTMIAANSIKSSHDGIPREAGQNSIKNKHYLAIPIQQLVQHRSSFRFYQVFLKL